MGLAENVSGGPPWPCSTCPGRVGMLNTLGACSHAQRPQALSTSKRFAFCWGLRLRGRLDRAFGVTPPNPSAHRRCCPRLDEPPARACLGPRPAPTFSTNVRDIRSFSGTKWEKNLGEGRADPRTVYLLLNVPTTERRRAQRGRSDRRERRSRNFSALETRHEFLHFFNIFFDFVENIIT